MQSHTQSASALEACFLSSPPETIAPASVPPLMSPIVYDPASGVHAPGCTCAGRHVRLSRGN